MHFFKEIHVTLFKHDSLTMLWIDDLKTTPSIKKSKIIVDQREYKVLLTLKTKNFSEISYIHLFCDHIF